MEAKRKRTKNIIIAAVLVAVAILMAALPAMLSSGQKEENTGTAKSVAVQRGDIDSTVAGAGTLSGGDGVKITVPHGVEITEYLVANGDVVAEGQALAAVDKTSVMNTIATVQNNLEYLAGEVRTAASGATNAYLATPAAGRVKAIYANAGDDVQSVIREHGALMVVSLDGRMAVDAETASDAATPGKSVTVRCEDGTEYPGRIEIRRGSTLTVTLTDNGPVLGAKADILLDGETVGTGTLYAHSAWNVTASAGTVAAINTAVERQVYAGTTVLTLRDVDAEGEYRRLSQLHRDYEDTMLKLFRLYQTGTVTASAAGRVSDLDTAHLGVMRNTGSYTAALLASPSEGVPEEYTVRPALLSEVTFGSMTFLAAPAAADVDLTAEPVVDTESAESIPVTSFDGVSVYDWDADASDWAASNPNRLAKGDLVYLVYDENGVLLWVVRPQKPEEPEFPDDSIIWGGGGGGEGRDPGRRRHADGLSALRRRPARRRASGRRAAGSAVLLLRPPRHRPVRHGKRGAVRDDFGGQALCRRHGDAARREHDGLCLRRPLRHRPERLYPRLRRGLCERRDRFRQLPHEKAGRGYR